MGRWLVEMLENVAQEWRMTKIMLTVLKGWSNELPALRHQ
jgi:hypothetical protein